METYGRKGKGVNMIEDIKKEIDKKIFNKKAYNGEVLYIRKVIFETLDMHKGKTYFNIYEQMWEEFKKWYNDYIFQLIEMEVKEKIEELEQKYKVEEK